MNTSSADSTDIFVFGSNLAGIHGKGAAAFAARHHNARKGIGKGRTGSAYAIPTKDRLLHVLPLEEIEQYVDEFIDYAAHHPDLDFILTPIGCGLAGYKYEQIAPLFAEAPPNVLQPIEFMDAGIFKK